MIHCKTVVGLIFGHNYKPVITKSAPIFPANISRMSGDPDILESMRKEIFHGMICTRCGYKLEG